jgi:hypothetical protein
MTKQQAIDFEKNPKLNYGEKCTLETFIILNHFQFKMSELLEFWHIKRGLTKEQIKHYNLTVEFKK